MALFRVVRRELERGVWRIMALVAVGALLPSTASAQTGKGSGNWLDPYSPVGQQIAQLYDIVYYIAIGVFVIVEGLLLYAVFRFRYRKEQAQRVVPQVHGNTTLEITWTAIPALIVAGLFVLTFNVMNDIHAGPDGTTSASSLNPVHNSHAVAATLAGQAPPGALRVEAIGHQWWWEFRYPELGITTATMMHVPAGRAIEVLTTSEDVIHAWWAPQMTGKLDAVPGVTNATWFQTQPDQTGVYHAQCAEFCGDEHAVMQFRVQVDSPEDFERWAAQQAQPAQPINADLAQQGQALFVAKGCVGCHAIAGHPDPLAQDDGNKIGPNLTHLYSRPLIAGGALSLPQDNIEVARGNLARWLRNPEEVKPGNLMASAVKPGYLTEENVRALTEYLLSLK